MKNTNKKKISEKTKKEEKECEWNSNSNNSMIDYIV